MKQKLNSTDTDMLSEQIILKMWPSFIWDIQGCHTFACIYDTTLTDRHHGSRTDTIPEMTPGP